MAGRRPSRMGDAARRTRWLKKAWEQFNEAAYEKFNTDTLQPCPHCNRTFLPDRLQVHLRSCGGGHFANPVKRPAGGGGGDGDGSESTRSVRCLSGPNSRGGSQQSGHLRPRSCRRGGAPPPPRPSSAAPSSPSSSRVAPQMKGAPPRLPSCHLCGRQFGTTSLGIHIKACKQRWEREHGRAAPEPDVEMPLGAPAGSKAWEQFNAAANSKFNTDTLQPCPHCNRTFLPDRLPIHLRSCASLGFKPRPNVVDGSPGGEDGEEAPWRECDRAQGLPLTRTLGGLVQTRRVRAIPWEFRLQSDSGRARAEGRSLYRTTPGSARATTPPESRFGSGEAYTPGALGNGGTGSAAGEWHGAAGRASGRIRQGGAPCLRTIAPPRPPIERAVR